MSFTYDPENADTISQVRTKIGDTQEDEQFLADEVITYLLAEHNDNILLTALAAAQAIWRSLARNISTSALGVSLSRDQQFEHYRLVIDDLTRECALQAGSNGVYMGGLSRSDKELQYNDITTVPAAFSRRTLDNYAPTQQNVTYLDY